MDILFINIQLRPGNPRKQLPVGLAYIMTAVKKAGFEFDLIDMDIDDLSMKQLKNRINKKIYDVYCMGCVVTGYSKVKQIANIIRDVNPYAKIVIGNSVASSIPDILFSTTSVDYIVMGEGDVTIVSLLKSLDKKSGNRVDQVKGIALPDFVSIKRNIIEDLDRVGFPDWDLFDLKKYAKYSKVNVNDSSGKDIISFPLNSARGCPNNCGFCYHVFKGEKYRRYSIDAVIGEMRRLRERYGCNYISFWDELTFPNKTSLRMFLNELIRKRIDIRWEATIRAGVFDMSDVDLLKSAKDLGCDNMSFSLESGSPEILRAMNKRMKVGDFIKQAEVFNTADIKIFTSVIFGYPQETLSTIEQTINVCEKVNIFPSSGFLLPMPGTSVYDQARRMGKISDEVEYLGRIGDRQDLHINLTAMSDDELVNNVELELSSLASKLGIKGDVFKTISGKK